MATEYIHVKSVRPNFEWRIYVHRGMNGNVYIQASEGDVSEPNSFVVAYGGPTASRQVRIDLPECKRITAKVQANAVETMKAKLRELEYIA